MTVHQGVLDRILQIGAVDFDNASAQQGDLFRFTGVGSPERVVRAIDLVHEDASAKPAPPVPQGRSRPALRRERSARTYAVAGSTPSPAASRSACALSVLSHVKSASSRPKWP